MRSLAICASLSVAGPGTGSARFASGVGQPATSALAIHLLKPHAGLPAGAILLVPYVGAPKLAPPPSGAPATNGAATIALQPPARPGRHARRKRHLPLTVTPPLGLAHYLFPVAGESSFGDSYGAPRSDVAGGWHHGDDIFARLGTPVVAVADGTLNRVGWERIGGWRLWVRDALGNEFYQALRSKRVKAGEVIGFVGDTGDAFTTPPHLHFEIHPRLLLHLHYDGAVNPTSYLTSWPHVVSPRLPLPVHPRFPKSQRGREAETVFRQLLVLRHLPVGHRDAGSRARLQLEAGLSAARMQASARAASRSAATSSALYWLLTAAVTAAALAAAYAGFRRRSPVVET